LNRLERFGLDQAACPRGLAGWLLGKAMARFTWPDNRWTVDILNLQPEDNVIEIGCGPGVAALYAARRAGHVWGFDHSLSMLRQACERSSRAASPGPDLHQRRRYPDPVSKRRLRRRSGRALDLLLAGSGQKPGGGAV